MNGPIFLYIYIYICDSHCTYRNVIRASNFADALHGEVSHCLAVVPVLLGGTSTENTPPLLTTELAGGGVSLQARTDMPFSTLCSNTGAACSTNITGQGAS